MHIHSYNKRITITNIRNFMHLYHGLIQVLMLITDLCLFGIPVGVTELIRSQNLYLYNRLIFIQDSHRSYRAYSYSEIPVGIHIRTTPSFPLIQYSSYYHITMGTPRLVLIIE